MHTYKQTEKNKMKFVVVLNIFKTQLFLTLLLEATLKHYCLKLFFYGLAFCQYTGQYEL